MVITCLNLQQIKHLIALSVHQKVKFTVTVQYTVGTDGRITNTEELNIAVVAVDCLNSDRDAPCSCSAAQIGFLKGTIIVLLGVPN